MEAKMPNLGDIITDHTEGCTGIVKSLDVHSWGGFMLGSVRIHWLGEGTFATAPEEVMVAIESGDWTVQSDLQTAWGWEFPRSNEDD
jgi:hypothetical protein